MVVLAGAVLYRERLSGPQKLATALAAAGVGAELLRAGGVSWETWLVAVGYPLYFALRRRLRTEKLGGHWVDMALAVPVALYFVCLLYTSPSPRDRTRSRMPSSA